MLAVLGLAGAGAVYFFMANRDTTPVGLTITKTVESNRRIGRNGEDEYGIGLVEGTFRESDSTLPISSESENRPLLVVSKNGVTIEAKVVNKPEEKSLAAIELALEVAKKYDLDSQEHYEERVAGLKQQTVQEPVLNNAQTQNAEFMMLGHVGLNALQSNHSW